MGLWHNKCRDSRLSGRCSRIKQEVVFVRGLTSMSSRHVCNRHIPFEFQAKLVKDFRVAVVKSSGTFAVCFFDNIETYTSHMFLCIYSISSHRSGDGALTQEQRLVHICGGRPPPPPPPPCYVCRRRQW